MTLAIDRAELARFVHALFPDLDPMGYVSLRAFRQFPTKGEREGERDRPLHIEPIRLNLGLEPVIDAAERIAARVSKGGEAAVFAPPVCTFTSRKGARAGDVHECPVLSVEIDQGNLEQIIDRLSIILGARPTIALHSGSTWVDPETGELLPKGHLHWRLRHPARGPDQQTMLRRARDIATVLAGGDPSATPTVHPLRWPGSWNRKTDPPVMATIIEENAPAAIDLAEALASLEDAAQASGLGMPRSATHLAADDLPAELAQLAEWLRVYTTACLPPAGLGLWHDWNKVAMAIHRATGGSEAGYEAFRAWSATSPHYNAAGCRGRWDAISGCPATWIGARYLRRKAREHGWTEPPPDAAEEPFASPHILVLGGKRHEAADAGLAALQRAGIQFYQRDKSLVRIARIKAKASDGAAVVVPSVTPVNSAMLSRALGQATRWEKISRDGDIIAIDPPKEVVEQIAVMTDEWPFPPLRGLIDTPTLRPDGSLLQQPGYDPATGYFLCNPPPMQPIPERPSQSDALEALALLNSDLLAEFPFVDNAARSVALSMLLTPVLRAAMAVVPMHVVTAPEAGTGKSYLADIASAIAVGDRCAVMAVSDKAEETEKRLIGAAMAQFPIIALDNVSTLLWGDFLCQVTERAQMQVRPLGTSGLVRIANTFTCFANGNNLVIGADAVRRCIQCALDADMETPEERIFSGDPVKRILADRGRYIRACLIIARAYLAASRPGRLPPRASYEAWSDLVRSALVWLGWSDPVETVAAIRTEDPIRQQRAQVFAAWAGELILGIGYQTSELITQAEEWAQAQRTHPKLFAALFTVAGARGSGQQIDPRRLAHWLRHNLGTIANRHKLTVDRADQTRPRWVLSAP